MLPLHRTLGEGVLSSPPEHPVLAQYFCHRTDLECLSVLLIPLSPTASW